MAEHYFSPSPSSPGKNTTKTLRLGAHDFVAHLAPGVFSSQRLDPGTQVLLERCPLPEVLSPRPQTDPAVGARASTGNTENNGPTNKATNNGNRDATGPVILDLGCGWGPITMFLAKRFPQARVFAVDVNERARDLCALNCRTNGLENVQVLDPEVALDVLRTLRVDLLWSNPPIRIGKNALHSLLSQWLELLSAQGWADLVVSKNLGADSLSRWLATEGYGVERVASARGYRVLQVFGPTSSPQNTAQTSGH